MEIKKDIGNNLVTLSFSCDSTPVFQEKKMRTSGVDFVSYGTKNDYPDFLITLFNTSSKHNAIVNGKVTYIFGKGLKGEIPTVWDEKINRFGDSINDIAKRIVLDVELFGGSFIQIIPDQLGNITDVIILPYWKVRSSKNGDEFYYKNNWKDGGEDVTVLKQYLKGSREPNQIRYYKEYRPGIDVYTLPQYVASIPYIQADAEVGEQVYNNAQGGFTASKMITFFNGTPTPEAVATIEKKLENKFTGKRGKKFMLQFLQGSEKKTEIDDLGASDLTKEDFEHVDKLIEKNIFAGHQITSPSLFGIQSEGNWQLGNRSQLRDAYEVFNNTYVNGKQQNIECLINSICEDAGMDPDYKFIPVEPIGFEFSEQSLLTVAPKKWLLEKIGIDPALYPETAALANPAPAAGVAPQGMTNDNIKNLTGRQHQQLLRIIKQYGQQKITRDVAMTLLKTGLGLNDAEINTMLGNEDVPVAMSFSADEFKDIVNKFGEDRNAYQVVRKKPVDFTKNSEAALHEFAFQKNEFAEISKVDLEILKLIQGDKMISNDTIANVLKVEPSYIQSVIDNYIAEKVLSVNRGGEKTVLKPVSEITDKPVKIFIKYSYELNSAEAAGPNVKDTTREFCKHLVEAGKFYTRSEIELMSEYLGYSVWDRRGGFWTHGKQDSNPGKTTAYCRHLWHSNVIYKK
jgi:hypothetical protein